MPVITIVGAGNGGHVLSAIAGSLPDYEVRVVTRRPDLFADKTVTVQRPGIGGGGDIVGTISMVTANPGDVIEGSDIVIWCGPVVATKEVFEMLAPFVRASKRPMYVGCLFGQGCIHLLAKKCFGEDVPFFCFQNIPWLCTTIVPGKICSIVGRKKYTSIACHRVNFTWLKKTLQPCLAGPTITQLADFSSIVLNPANQIIHPARYWGIFKDWDGKPIKPDSIPWLYRDFDDTSAEALEGLDVELQNIKRMLCSLCPELDLDGVIPLRNRILAQYGEQVADASNLRQIMATNQAYMMAKTPVLKVAGGVIPNFDHRVVQDDIPHGLCVVKDIAELLHEKTPWIDLLIEWHQNLMKKEYIVNGHLTGKDMEDCTTLSVLGGSLLAHIGFVDLPIVPSKI